MQRYLVTMQFYINAKDDEHAKFIARHEANSLDLKTDKKHQVTDLETAPFGKIGQNRKIKLTQ